MDTLSPQNTTLKNILSLEKSTQKNISRIDKNLRKANLSEKTKTQLLAQQQELCTTLTMMEENKQIIYKKQLDTFLHTDNQNFPSFKNIPHTILIPYLKIPEFQQKVRLSQLDFNNGVINALDASGIISLSQILNLYQTVGPQGLLENIPNFFKKKNYYLERSLKHYKLID